MRDKTNPFLLYNWSVYKELPPSWDREGHVALKSKLIFQEFRHGDDRRRKPNIITIERNDAERWGFEEPIICLGRSAENDLVFDQMSVSRRHCVFINYAEDVWLYDLCSTHGTYIDGRRVESPVFLEGHCHLSIGDNELTVLPKEGILL